MEYGRKKPLEPLGLAAAAAAAAAAGEAEEDAAAAVDPEETAADVEGPEEEEEVRGVAEADEEADDVESLAGKRTRNFNNSKHDHEIKPITPNFHRRRFLIYGNKKSTRKGRSKNLIFHSTSHALNMISCGQGGR